MKQERKQELLRAFPPVPDKITAQMTEKAKKCAGNYAIFLTNGNELFVRCYHRYYGGDLIERQRYVFAKDGCCRYGLKTNGDWAILKEFREPVFCAASYGYNFDNSYTALNIEAIKRSCMRYSYAETYNGTLLMEYLKLYLKHPNIEYLMKSGYQNTICENECCDSYWSVRLKIAVDPNVNLNSNNLLKMLGLNRTEFKALTGSAHCYSEYMSWRKERPEYKPDELVRIAKVFGNQHGTAGDISRLTGARLPRIARYIEEQSIFVRDYIDYIRQCQELDYNLHDTAICMPHDFRAMHTRLSQIIDYSHNAEARRLFDENYPARIALEYSSGKYFIRQPHSMNEIIVEGKTLSHCVGGYARRHAKGALNILFIRKIDDPDTPLYTMELSAEGKIVQVRGLNNCDPTKGAKAFVEEYKKYIAPLFERQKARKTA